MSKLISILIPVFNRKDFLEETLDSIVNQTFRNWECILVDDGSTDGSIEICEEYVNKDKRFSFYQRLREPKGANSCRNIGYEKSNGDYIVWFDSDDIMEKEFLDEHAKELQNDKVDCSLCDVVKYFPEKGEKKQWLSNTWLTDEYDVFVKNYIEFNYGLGICSIVWKRKVIEDQGLFDETIHQGHEYEYFARIFIKRKLNIAKINKVLVLYRQHDNNHDSQMKQGDKVKLVSALETKLMVIAYAKDNKIWDIELENYFIKDSLGYLGHNIKEVEKLVEKILKTCGTTIYAEYADLNTKYIDISNKYNGIINSGSVKSALKLSSSMEKVKQIFK